MKIPSLLSLCIIVLILVPLSFTSIDERGISSNIQPILNSIQTVYAAPTASWHVGANQSTSLVDVSYNEWYQNMTSEIGAPITSPYERLSRDMWLTYNDGTRSSLALMLDYNFWPGGLNLSNQQVLNWTKLNNIQVTLGSWGSLNGTGWQTLYTFNGFQVINGTAQDFALTKNWNNVSATNFSYGYSVNNGVGLICYGNCSAAEISAVTLSTTNATYNGKALTESVATFNLTLEAQIIARANDFNQTLNNVPVVLTFQVTHNIYYTQYKYGVDIDWSIDKAFPTMGVKGTLKTGDNFSLVAQDGLSYFYGTASFATHKSIGNFSTDAENDTAMYIVNGTVFCRELLPTNYTINGSPTIYNTTRVYIPDAMYNSTSPLQDSSSIFVIFSGFVYNQSSGFTFDPAVITYNSVTASNTLTEISPTALNILMVIILAATIAIVFRRHKRTSKTLKETSIKA